MWGSDVCPGCPGGGDEAVCPSEGGNKVTFTALIM